MGFSNLSGTWYRAFLQLLEGPKTSLPERLQSISLVIFNYDRCIEAYLFESLQMLLGSTQAEAADLVLGMKIYHPYGTVGNLPWMERGNSIDFGNEPNATELFTLATQIRTFTEGTNPDSSDIEQVRQQLNDADVVVFLGFAYHEMNLQLLAAKSNVRSSAGVAYGTAVDMSASARDVVRADLKKILGLDTNNSFLGDYNCTRLFNEFSRVWSVKLNEGA